jgi:uncharacterized protein
MGLERLNMKIAKLYSQPSFEMSSKNKLLNRFLQTRLLNLRIDDNLTTYIDQLTLSFDNRSFNSNQFIPTPNSGKDLHLKLGYLPAMKDMGNFYIDSWTVSAPPATLQVTAKSIDLTKGFFNQQTEVWQTSASEEKKTMTRVIEAIAKKYGLTTQISAIYNDEMIQEYQYVESDIHFLSRLAKQYNAFYKIKANKLIFMEYDELKANKKWQIQVSLSPQNTQHWQVQHQEGENYTRVEAYWYDYDTASYQQESYPQANNQTTALAGEKKFTIREIFSIKEEANYACKAKFRLLARNKQIITLQCLGNPELATGKILTLKQFQSEINGNWILDSIQHQFDSRGFISHIHAYRYT